MAKKQGIDDISKAIMEAIKAARATGKKAKPASIEVSDGMTKTYPKKQVKDPVFGMQKVKIDSGDAYRSYDKGTPEYNAAYKKKMADKKRLDKLNKMPSSGKNKEYKQALESEDRLKNWDSSKNFAKADEDTKIVRNYLNPKKSSAKSNAKKETWMMPDGTEMPKKKAKKALKKYGPK